MALRTPSVSARREWVEPESRKKEDAHLGTPRVGVFRRECAMRLLKPFTSNTKLITLCSRCHHSEFIHGDPTGGPCLFSECKCQRFAPKPQPKDSPGEDGEMSA